MRHIEEIEARIARFDTRLLAELESERDALALLQTIPGVDLIGAAMLLVEIGTDMDALVARIALASWVGICPGNNESAGKRKSGHLRKGNLYVRRLLLRIRSRRQSYHVSVQVEVPVARRPAWPQARHHRHRPQNPPHHLLHAQTARTLPGFRHRL